MKRTKTILTGLIFFLSLGISGEVRFSDLDITDNTSLLFNTEVNLPGFGNYDTLVKADITEGSLEPLTFFPEQLSYLTETDQIQVLNRFGLFRTSSLSGKGDRGVSMSPVLIYPSFANGDSIQQGKVLPVGTSPDGNYLVYLKPDTHTLCSLIFYDLNSGDSQLISRNIQLDYQNPSVLWSPDSRVLLYSRDMNIYYYSVDHFKQKRILDEDYRMVSKGSLKNCYWNSDNTLFYISRDQVSSIPSAELFTSSFYAMPAQINGSVGKIPVEFDPNFDSFWVSPDGKSLLFNKGNKTLFLFELPVGGSLSSIRSLPYLTLPWGQGIKEIAWTGEGTIYLLAGSVLGEANNELFTLSPERDSLFTSTGDTGVVDIALSPDEDSLALISSGEVIIRNLAVKGEDKVFAHEGAFSLFWTQENTVAVAGSHLTEAINLDAGSRTLLFLSQPGEASGYNSDNEIQTVDSDKISYIYDSNRAYWKPGGDGYFRDKRVTSDIYRVYLEKTEDAAYLNKIMVREINGFKTNALFTPPVRVLEPFPGEDGNALWGDLVFEHGSRMRRREVSLVFNAVDSDEGLISILNSLKDYNIRATFFINGDFIRHYPDAVKAIADAGHEIGSLFYTNIDMTDLRYQINKDFIKKGLARNEDEYYRVTGREVSTLWHAPFYAVNSSILDASSEMNYLYVGRDIDSLDWVGKNQEGYSASLYMDASSLAERIIEMKQPGSVIPVSVGISAQREDYLFQKMDQILNALTNKGFEIVSVSALKEHAR